MKKFELINVDLAESLEKIPKKSLEDYFGEYFLVETGKVDVFGLFDWAIFFQYQKPSGITITKVDAPGRIVKRLRSGEEFKKEGSPLSAELVTERLKTQLLAERRASKAQSEELTRLRAQNDNQLEYIGNLSKALKELQGALTGAIDLRIRAYEKHRGIVTEVHGNEIAVVYETDEGRDEQIYHRDQFMHGKLPEPGEVIETFVIVTVGDSGTTERAPGHPSPKEMQNVFKRIRERGVSGPVEID